MFDLKSLVIGIVLMIKKYTIFNITIYAETTEEDYKLGIMFLPLLGFLLGLAAYLISFMRYVYDGYFVSALIVLYYVIVTGNVNLIDTYRTLNYIIKPKSQSEHISGTIIVVSLIILYYSLIRLVPITALLMMFVAGYSSLILMSTIFKRNKNGTSIIKYCGKYHKIAAFALSFLFVSIINYKLVITLSLTYIITGMIVSLIDKKIKLLPNSVEGFIIESAQLIFLTITYLINI